MMMSNISYSASIHSAMIQHNADWHAMWQQRGNRLVKLAAELEETRRQRDMLARRCAEQAKHIAGLLELKAEDAAEAERHPLADAAPSCNAVACDDVRVLRPVA